MNDIMNLVISLYVTFFIVVNASRPPAFVQLSLSSDPTKMHVQWSTGIFPWPASQGDTLGTGISTVQYGLSPRSLSMTSIGTNWSWVDTVSPTNRTYTHHLVTMTGLVPNTIYFYRVGVPLDGWSSVSSFRSTRLSTDISSETPLRLLFYGDMGWTNAQALSYLQDEVSSSYYDAIINLGDYAYDLENMDGLFGDEFQLSIQPITTTTPGKGCVGNHEGTAGFQHYLHRFRVFAADSTDVTPSDLPGVLPGLPNNFWYAFNLGIIHFAVVSTECYFIEGCPAIQYKWLEADLQVAKTQRIERPWLIVFAHRSIYCSCDDDCDFAATAVRDGIMINGTRMYGMEPILNKYNVDLFLNGHEHNMERNYAVFNSTLVTGATSGHPGGNASSPEVIVNPTAPIYIIEGCAGDKENHEPFTRPQPAYSAFRSNTYGYGRMTLFNESHLLFEQVQTDNGQPETTGSVIDAMLLIKNNSSTKDYTIDYTKDSTEDIIEPSSYLTPTLTLNTSIATDGDAVQITVNIGQVSPSSSFWIGLFDAFANETSALPIKITYPFISFPGFNETGIGSGVFIVTNLRTPLVFRLFSGSLMPPRESILATSHILEFDDYSAPLRPRVLPGKSNVPGVYTIAWTSNRSDNNPRLLWGVSPGEFIFSIIATGTSIERSALFGSPANDTGFFDLGVTLSAVIDLRLQTLPPRIYFKAVDNDHPFGASFGASEGNFIPPPLPFIQGEFKPATFIAFGDLGIGSFDDAVAFQEYGANARYLPAFINSEVQAGASDFVVLYGDLSYSVGWLQTWDEFVSLFSSFARWVPVLTSPGNHETLSPHSSSWSLFGNANDSGGEGNLVAGTLFPPPSPATFSEPWYSFVSGPFYLLMMSSEHDWTTGSIQHMWLSKTLAGVDRLAQPWLILTLHRQIYTDTILVDTLNYTTLFQMHIEPLLQQFKVSCVLVGHAHKWERLSSIVGGKVVLASIPIVQPDGTIQHVFQNPRAPVHFIAGMGGADHVINDCRRYRQAPYFMNCTVPEYSEDEGYDQGYLSITALSTTELRLNYIASVIGPNITSQRTDQYLAGIVIQSIIIQQDLNQTWEEV